VIHDLLGNLIQLPDGRRYTPRQDQPLEFAVGRRWTMRCSMSNSRTGKNDAMEAEFHISGKERITVPAYLRLLPRGGRARGFTLMGERPRPSGGAGSRPTRSAGPSSARR